MSGRNMKAGHVRYPVSGHNMKAGHVRSPVSGRDVKTGQVWRPVSGENFVSGRPLVCSQLSVSIAVFEIRISLIFSTKNIRNLSHDKSFPAF